jgi:kinesin family protein 1
MMVEIYMDRLQDLLVDPKNRKLELKIRESKMGIYVENARKEPVTSFDTIQSLIDQGERNKSVSATKMNATSSRGHTIVTIQITKVTHQGGAKSST